MKIQGSNLAKLAAYHTQLQQQTRQEKTENRKDQLNISNEAMRLQKNKQPDTERAEHVQSIKKAVQSGTYQVEAEKVAQKMIDFWSNHS